MILLNLEQKKIAPTHTNTYVSAQEMNLSPCNNEDNFLPLSSFHLLLKMRCDIQFIPQLFIRLFNRKKLISLPHIVSDGIFKQTYGRVWFVQAYGHKYQKVQMLIQQIELKNVSKYFLIVTCVSMCFFIIYMEYFNFKVSVSTNAEF